jgi:hypothetical protein
MRTSEHHPPSFRQVRSPLVSHGHDPGGGKTRTAAVSSRETAAANDAEAFGKPSAKANRYSRPGERARPAAVIEPDSPDATDAPRVIPLAAKRVMLGKAQLGYWLPEVRRGTPSVVRNVMRSEVETIILNRHNGPCDTDDGGCYAFVAINLLAQANKTAEFLRAWCAHWTPNLPAPEAEQIIAEAIQHPRWFKADTVARMLGVKLEERTALGLTTIGAVDCSRAARAEARKERNKLKQRERDAAERMAKAANNPAKETAAAACKRLSVSRSTYFKHKKAGTLAALETARLDSKEVLERIGVQKKSLMTEGRSRSAPRGKQRKRASPRKEPPWAYLEEILEGGLGSKPRASVMARIAELKANDLGRARQVAA